MVNLFCKLYHGVHFSPRINTWNINKLIPNRRNQIDYDYTYHRCFSSLANHMETPELSGFPAFLKSVESKWRMKLMRRFERERFVGANQGQSPKKLPRYMLSMFPYPSGRLHLGHVRIYTSGDVLARYSKLLLKQKDHNLDYDHVINPMGFDSFGLPAENAAKERGLNPAAWTNSNIRTMKQQMDDLGLQFDWREATSNPSFYKWTQHLYLQLMDAGLVYKSFALVNWDPVDKTVLADEQVDENGRSWRSGALVEKRNYKQWFIKVNAFTNEIYKAADVDPDSWRDILAIQRSWIGRPSGWLFYLPVGELGSQNPDILPIFTANPEFFKQKDVELLISDEHWLEKIHLVSKESQIKNPFTGGTLKVSLTDKYDYLPSATNATLRVRSGGDESHKQVEREQVLLHAKLSGLGGYYTSDKYRDWLVSRQRFWGTPIPIVNCNGCGHVRLPDKSLPVTLPAIDKLSRQTVTNDDSFKVISPLEEMAPKSWLEIDCPSCGHKATRECETFDTLFDSSWYFLRYATGPLSDKPFDPDLTQPVWCYIGGKEHASMHLFYARFISHFLHSLGQLKFKEPFKKLLVQGVVKSRTYKFDGKYLTKSEFDAIEDKSKATVEYEKMSKSKGNGVDPQDLIDKYGTDATRFCLMSYANPRSERLWRNEEEEFKDVMIFLRRVTLTVNEYVEVGNSMIAKRDQDSSIKIKELDDIELVSKKSLIVESRNRNCLDATFHIQESNQFRQYISALHSLIGPIRSNLRNSVVYTKEFAEALAALIIMLNPLTPHLSEELWLRFSKCLMNPLKTDSRYQTSLQASDQPWPLPDTNYPRLIKIRDVNSEEYSSKISISRERLNSSAEIDIAQLVESHFESQGDSCQVLEVQKFNNLSAIVIAKIDSVRRKSKRRKS